MKYQILIYILLVILLTSCLEECPDKEYYYMEEIDEEFVSFILNDTIKYKNHINGKYYYIICGLNEVTQESFFVDDQNCENGGYYKSYDIIQVKLYSNLPNIDNAITYIFIKLVTVSNLKSRIEITIQGIDTSINKTTQKQPYEVLLDKTSKKLISKYDGYSYYPLVEFIDSIEIEKKYYTDVFMMFFKKGSEDDLQAFYDTIYYNKDGFLKLVSSKYGFDFERVE